MLLVFAGHELDLRRQELRRGGERVHVEPQVFDLLVHLIRHRDRVVSKDELFDTIWNGRIVSEAALSSRINAARRAVGDDGDRQGLVKTFHKRGFRFVGEVTEIAPPPAGATELPAAGIGASRPAGAAAAAEATPAGAPPPAAPEIAATAPRAIGKKPSVAVLPFANPGQEQDTEYFAYGLTEDLVRLLARYRWLEVLSRHSAAAYRGREVDAREIGAALGVRYLVQGSVWKRAGHVRITGDLVCAETGRHLWSDEYDIGLVEILDIQASMAQQMAAVIEPELARLEREAAIRRPPGNLDAWDCYQRGLYHLWGFSTPAMAEAEAMFRRAIELDPTFARAHGALAYVLLQISVLRQPEERPPLLDAALRLARSAVALDDGDCMNHCVLGRAHTFRQDYEEAQAALDQAILLNPSFAQGHFALGFLLLFRGQPEEAIACLERATELSPRDPHLSSFHAWRALAHLMLGDLEAAASLAQMGARVPNAQYWPHVVLTAALGLLGRRAEAARALDGLLERQPGSTLATLRADMFFCRDQAIVELVLGGLRLAGMAEGTPRTQAA